MEWNQVRWTFSMTCDMIRVFHVAGAFAFPLASGSHRGRGWVTTTRPVRVKTG